MSKIDDFRAKFPEYGALSDQELADTMYRKFYADKLSREEFDRRVAGSDQGFFSGLTGAAKQEVTFGLADEVAGLAGGVANVLKGQPFSEGYERATRRVRGDVEQFREEHPVASLSAGLAGGFASVPARAVQAVRQAPTLGRAIMEGARTGAGFGAVSGAGHAEGGVENRIAGAGAGALTGGAIGSTLPAVAAAGGKVIGKIADVSGLRNPPRAARNQILRALERDGLTPEEALARYNQWQRQGAKPEALFDLGGENVRGLARAAAGVPGRAKNEAVEFLSRRQAAQAERISDDVAALLNPNRDFHGTVDQLMRRRAQEAAPLYDEAYRAVNVWNDDLERLLRRPSMKQALARAYRIAAEEGRDPHDLGIAFNELTGDANIIKMPSMQTWDYVKRGLDDVIEQFRDPVTGKLRLDESGRAINATKNELLAQLDEMVPAYRAARQAWEGRSSSIDAMNLGRNIFRPDSEITAKRIAEMSDSDKEFFRAGVVRAIRDAIENAPDGADVVKRFFNRPAMRRKLREAFPSEEAFQKFESLIRREAQMFANAQMVSPRAGSQTALRQAEVGDLAEDPSFLTSLFMGDLVNAARQGGQSLLRRSQGITSATADELAPMLFTTDVPNQLRALMAQQALNRLRTERLGRAGNALRRTLAITGGGAVAPSE